MIHEFTGDVEGCPECGCMSFEEVKLVDEEAGMVTWGRFCHECEFSEGR